jgi:hypothetical protein
LVGERNPDSVLFNVRELDEDNEFLPPENEEAPAPEVEVEAEAEAAPPAEVEPSGEAALASLLPPTPTPTAAQQKAQSSGLVNIGDLLAAEEAEIKPLDHGLAKRSPPASESVIEEAVDVTPPSRMPQMIMIAGLVAVIVALLAVLSAG